ncbi:MAG: aspartyl protease family protein [Chthoniobacterales bacterium]
MNLKIHGVRFRYLWIVCAFLAMTPPAVSRAAKQAQPTQLPGYKAVPVHYGPLNKMIISVSINGHPANLLVDTGANQIILDASAAELFDVRPSQHGFRYIRFTQINGQLFPVGFVRSVTAGGMNFGSSLVTLRNSRDRSNFSNRAEDRNLHIDGVLGADILLRHKAIINCRTKFIFFKIGRSQPLQLASVALSEKFTKVPLQQEENGAFTVPYSIHGQSGRLLVDTGAFITTFNEATVKSLGIALQPVQASARFTNGVARRISVGQISDFTIGDFKVPSAKFGTAVLPNFALQQGNTRINGILGMDLLFICHGIIDFDSMSLFLK